MTIYDYARMSDREKERSLKSKALFLDEQKKGEERIFLYFLNGFFVEVTEKNGKVIENLPYKRGFSVHEKALNYKAVT
jgi:hypothetical protein